MGVAPAWVKACPHLMRIGRASGRCVLKCELNMSTLVFKLCGHGDFVRVNCAATWRIKKRKTWRIRGIVSARVVPADQAVQVSLEGQDEKRVQPEETTTSACPKRLIKALISSTLQLDPAIASTVGRLNDDYSTFVCCSLVVHSSPSFVRLMFLLLIAYHVLVFAVTC